MAREHKTSDGLLAISAGALLLALAIAWAAMPWPSAMIATVCAFLGAEFGMVGARWRDERYDD